LKLPLYSLRAGILTQLIFLIVAAMLLINVVMVKFSERDLIQTRVAAGRLLVHAIEQNADYLLSHNHGSLSDLSLYPEFEKNIIQLQDDAGFSSTLIVDNGGTQVFFACPYDEERSASPAFVIQSTRTGAWSVQYNGVSWAVLWPGRREVSVSAPFSVDGKQAGGIVVTSSLNSVYEILRRTEKVIIFYIFMDTIILTIVGIYLLSRIVVKPIHKLLKMTQEYKDWDILPAIAESSRNEIGNLSRSLRNMLQKLDENKRDLESNISSLEKANSKLRQAQKEVIMSEKLVSVGRLAAGIAHEIGNPIGIVLGYLDLIRRGDISDNEKRDFLDRVESEISRINLIITQLLDFSRPSGDKPEKCHVHGIIRDIAGMLEPQPIMVNVNIDFEFSSSRDTVFANSNELQQVFLNIILNAADAFAEKDCGEEKRLVIKSYEEDGYIILKFKDNGPGIEKDDLGRVFDPFYTTKEPGKGTGLGLSVCYKIVEELAGKIKAESLPENGTAIIVFLPLHTLNDGGRGNDRI